MYKYRIIVTNHNSVSEQYEVQSSWNNESWKTMTQRTTYADAERFYNEMVGENTKQYGYKVLKSSE